MPIRKFARSLADNRPKWTSGSLSQADTNFLFHEALESRCQLAVEIGTGCGFSATILGHALHMSQLISQENLSAHVDFRVDSYDAFSRFYADQTKKVGDSAREQLPAEILKHVNFYNPFCALDMAARYQENELNFIFIDALHKHPWPTLDLLAILPCLKPGATVVLHDINLPLRQPKHSHWGVKHLFDALNLEKKEDTHEARSNIGSFKLPADKFEFKNQLIRIINSHPAEIEVSPQYLKRMGLPVFELPSSNI